MEQIVNSLSRSGLSAADLKKCIEIAYSEGDSVIGSSFRKKVNSDELNRLSSMCPKFHSPATSVDYEGLFILLFSGLYKTGQISAQFGKVGESKVKKAIKNCVPRAMRMLHEMEPVTINVRKKKEEAVTKPSTVITEVRGIGDKIASNYELPSTDYRVKSVPRVIVDGNTQPHSNDQMEVVPVKSNVAPSQSKYPLLQWYMSRLSSGKNETSASSVALGGVSSSLKGDDRSDAVITQSYNEMMKHNSIKG